MSTCLTLLGISLRSSLTLIKRVAAAVKSQRSGKNYVHIHICLFHSTQKSHLQLNSTWLILLWISLRSSLTLIKRVVAAVKSQWGGKNYHRIFYLFCLMCWMLVRKFHRDGSRLWWNVHLCDIIRDFIQVISYANKVGCRCCKITTEWEKLWIYLFVSFIWHKEVILSDIATCLTLLGISLR